MKQTSSQLIKQAQADTMLKEWRQRHNTPAKVAAAHRKVLLERVSQSMAFGTSP